VLRSEETGATEGEDGGGGEVGVVGGEEGFEVSGGAVGEVEPGDEAERGEGAAAIASGDGGVELGEEGIGRSGEPAACGDGAEPGGAFGGRRCEGVGVGSGGGGECADGVVWRLGEPFEGGCECCASIEAGGGDERSGGDGGGEWVLVEGEVGEGGVASGAGRLSGEGSGGGVSDGGGGVGERFGEDWASRFVGVRESSGPLDDAESVWLGAGWCAVVCVRWLVCGAEDGVGAAGASEVSDAGGVEEERPVGGDVGVSGESLFVGEAVEDDAGE